MDTCWWMNDRTSEFWISGKFLILKDRQSNGVLPPAKSWTLAGLMPKSSVGTETVRLSEKHSSSLWFCERSSGGRQRGQRKDTDWSDLSLGAGCHSVGSCGEVVGRSRDHAHPDRRLPCVIHIWDRREARKALSWSPQTEAGTYGLTLSRWAAQ